MHTRGTQPSPAPAHHPPRTGRRGALSSLGYDLRFAAGVVTDTVRTVRVR